MKRNAKMAENYSVKKKIVSYLILRILFLEIANRNALIQAAEQIHAGKIEWKIIHVCTIPFKNSNVDYKIGTGKTVFRLIFPSFS